MFWLDVSCLWLDIVALCNHVAGDVLNAVHHGHAAISWSKGGAALRAWSEARFSLHTRRLEFAGGCNVLPWGCCELIVLLSVS